MKSESEHDNQRPTVTIKESYRFFTPLIFMAELHMLSHAIISAFLARMPNSEPILAAYSIAFYLHATLGSPVWACQFVAISFLKDMFLRRGPGQKGREAKSIKSGFFAQNSPQFR